MVKLTKNVHKIVQNSSKLSFLRVGFPLIFASFRGAGVHALILKFRGGLDQGDKKYITSWEPRFFGHYFARDSVIHRPAEAL